MIKRLCKNLAGLKKEFVRIYDGSSNIQEIIPVKKSKEFPAEKEHLDLLHLFATKNPIYYNSYRGNVSGVSCVIYEGDINQYWLGSIGHDSSHAPFSPTWILSAFIAVLQAKELGYREIIDVGSGDGRIAYCAKILGLEPYSMEIDCDLVQLQKSIIDVTGFDFKVNRTDVTKFDFKALRLKRPVFFIGGLAQMGGNALAESIIENIGTDEKLKNNAGFALAGTYSKKYPDGQHAAGWGKLIKENRLDIITVLSLPTAWTLKEPEDTPYIFAGFAK